MGRGRQKAKQQKVARELKYSTHGFDADALQREFGTSGPGSVGHSSHSGERVSSSSDDVDEDDDEGWTGTGG